jgi:SAM-dependent methyltransferase
MKWIKSSYGNAPKVAAAFRWGTGVPQQEYGEEFWEEYERFVRPLLLAHLVQNWIPAVDGLAEKLRTGCQVAELGCGGGQALLRLASAYPDSHFVGYDLSSSHLERARSRLRDAGLERRVYFELCDVSEGITGEYDLICAFDLIHSLVDPLGALVAIREALAPDGVLLWSELPLSDELTENLRHPLAGFAYGISTLYCMTTSLADGGAGLGTCLGPKRVNRLSRRAGFGRIRRLPIEHPLAILYEVRP